MRIALCEIRQIVRDVLEEEHSAASRMIASASVAARNAFMQHVALILQGSDDSDWDDKEAWSDIAHTQGIRLQSDVSDMISRYISDWEKSTLESYDTVS